MRGRGLGRARRGASGVNKGTDGGKAPAVRSNVPQSFKCQLNLIRFGDTSPSHRLYTLEAACFASEMDDPNEGDWKNPKTIFFPEEVKHKGARVLEQTCVKFLNQQFGDTYIWDTGGVVMVSSSFEGHPEYFTSRAVPVGEKGNRPVKVAVRLVEGKSNMSSPHVLQYQQRVGHVMKAAVKRACTEWEGLIKEDKTAISFFPVTSVNKTSCPVGLREQYELCMDRLRNSPNIAPAIEAIAPFEPVKGFDIRADVRVDSSVDIEKENGELNRDALMVFASIVVRTTAFFPRAMNLIDVLKMPNNSHRPVFGGRGCTLHDKLRQSTDILKGLRFSRDGYPDSFQFKDREETIDGLHPRLNSANDEVFETPKGEIISVTQYLKQKYEIELKYPDLPLVAMKRPARQRKEYIPAELIKIVPQTVNTYGGALQNHFTNLSSNDTSVFRELVILFTRYFFHEPSPAKDLLNAWQLQLRANGLFNPEAILAEHPKVAVGGDSFATIENDCWNWNGHTFQSTSEWKFPGHLVFLNFGVADSDTWGHFMDQMVKTMNVLQFNVPRREALKVVPFKEFAGDVDLWKGAFCQRDCNRFELKQNIDRKIAQVLRLAFDAQLKRGIPLKNCLGGIFICLPNAHNKVPQIKFQNWFYDLVKENIEMAHKVPTQCFRPEQTPYLNGKPIRNPEQHISAIISGLNIKRVRSRNFVVFEEIVDKLQKASTMYLAIDSKNSEMGRHELGRRTYLGMVASLTPCVTQYAMAGAVMPCMHETSPKLRILMKQILDERKSRLGIQSNKEKPINDLVIFRTSMQYLHHRDIASDEIDALSSVIMEECGLEEEPRISIIVIIRHHHLRLLPSDFYRGGVQGESNNVPAGTIVTMCSAEMNELMPGEHDENTLPTEFLMLSHTPISKSTAVPIKVVTLRNDHKLKISEWGRAIFALCFQNQVNPKGVSLPAPSMYAQKVTERVRRIVENHVNDVRDRNARLLENQEAMFQGIDALVNKSLRAAPNCAFL